VLEALFKAEKSVDPEVRHRSKLTLRLSFLRVEMGRGAPKHGLTFKSKVLTINKKLRTRPMIAEVEAGGVAAETGVAPDDLVMSVNGVTFLDEDSVGQLRSYLNSRKPGSMIEMILERKVEGRETEVQASFRLPGSEKVEMEMSDDEEADFQRWRSRMEELLEARSDQ
jgi:predicted metalloprotease with PDZ domain